MEHTPGPWRTVERSGNTTRVDIVSDAESLPFTPSFVAGDILPEDARLIAAAPAMLDALMHALYALYDYGDSSVVAQVEAAIALARGTAEVSA